MGVYITANYLREAAYGLTIPEGTEVDASLERLITVAETRLLARAPSIPDRVASGALDIELVRAALADIVLRVVRNPEGYSSEQAGEFMYRLDRSVASGRIEIRPDDLVDLVPRRRYGGFGTIRLARSPWRAR